MLTIETRALKIMGYLWTFAWISWSMRYAAAYQYETGAMNHYEPLKFSVVDLVAGKMGRGAVWAMHSPQVRYLAR